MVALKRTSLYDFHAKHDARFVPFAGWEMPVQYTSILEEHRAVRLRAGLFDVSHMGEARITGPQARSFVNYIMTNDFSAIKPGQAKYTLMCNAKGGVVDDLIIYCIHEDEFFLCINAGNKKKDIAWLTKHAASFDCTVADVSDDYAQLALQGPRAFTILGCLTSADLNALKRFTFVNAQIAGVSSIVCRTGYTGEDGVEIFCAPNKAEFLAESILQAGTPLGLRLVGLGARDSLRLEAGYPLYGHEISDSISPLEAGLEWTVKFNKGDFIGKSALEAEKARGLRQKIIHFVLDDRRIAREGVPIWTEEAIVGEVVSGSLSPMLHQPIGSALVRLDQGNIDHLCVKVRKQSIPLEVKTPPLYQEKTE
jgi:aminomethyltransferase